METKHSNQPIGAFVFDGFLTEEMKLEIGQMLHEGVSPQGIAVVLESMFHQPVSYAAFTEYGKSPVTPFQAYMDKYPTWPEVVEGSITEPITDEGRLLE